MNPEDLTKQLEGTSPDSTDDEFNAVRNVNQHERRYTDILNAYADDLDSTLKKKRTYKTIIFWLSFFLLCLFPVVFVALIVIITFFSASFENITNWISVIVPVLISFLTVFIVIPQVITQYLFNAEEEKYMSDIIKHIQDYDKNHN